MLNQKMESKRLNGLRYTLKLRVVSGPLNTVCKPNLSVSESRGSSAPLSPFQDENNTTKLMHIDPCSHYLYRDGYLFLNVELLQPYGLMVHSREQLCRRVCRH